MSKTRPNDPVSMDHTNREYSGLTKREYFAAQSLIGILSSHANPSATHPKGFIQDECDTAVKFADALIEALNQNTDK